MLTFFIHYEIPFKIALLPFRSALHHNKTSNIKTSPICQNQPQNALIYNPLPFLNGSFATTFFYANFLVFSSPLAFSTSGQQEEEKFVGMSEKKVPLLVSAEPKYYGKHTKVKQKIFYEQ